MTQLTDDWVAAPETQAVCAMLTGAGFQALFVGGCVRNALFNLSVNDIDIATDARPETVVKLAKDAGLHAIPTGIDHGTVTIVSNHVPHEVTTFRRDVETDGRRAVVAYADSAEEDAHRRDFTMNALYATPEGDVIDPLGGLTDLQARRVRFIDDAEARIKEDYLRILRFFRFHAWYGDAKAGLDADGLAACAENATGIAALSKERIGAEVKKLLGAPDPAPSVASMAQAGVLMQAVPGADAKPLPILVHMEQQLGVEPDAIRRLAVIGGEDLPKKLRLSRDDARRLARLRDGIENMQAPAALGHYFGVDGARDVLLLRSAIFETQMPEGWESDVATGAAATFPIKAADLMPAYSGAALGAHLKELEARWVASGFSLGKDKLLS
ncbi:CCA tRNA nucleotidyltransferase [Actibacterium lipolyticum]|uniref:CCA-adding enzyme n=1 Tax=Actibacterium lipolyticum TaxID=1524263 RepID=A0A238KWQ7_9RHOB|nr:CCA tRNA nucleotidyltransferase [Actibacterium lipolyticum]SMX47021.1 CCA-adding enzyme [Actibacterium lipolyticum]